jgi:hypothetical protein
MSSGVFGPLNLFASGNRAVIVKGLWFCATFLLRHDGRKSDSDFLLSKLLAESGELGHRIEVRELRTLRGLSYALL